MNNMIAFALKPPPSPLASAVARFDSFWDAAATITFASAMERFGTLHDASWNDMADAMRRELDAASRYARQAFRHDALTADAMARHVAEIPGFTPAQNRRLPQFFPENLIATEAGNARCRDGVLAADLIRFDAVWASQKTLYSASAVLELT